MDWASELRETLKVRCVHLRTKAAFLHLPAPGTPENPYPTAIWWCGRTCEALGPDGSQACPSDCDDARGRSCYEPPIRP